MSPKEFIKGFIEMYRSHECLWNLSSPDYTNKNTKKSAYKELVDYCKMTYKNADNEFVKQKIQNLRTAFRKELNKVQYSMKSETGSDIYLPKLWYYDLLLFTVPDGLPHASLESRTNNEFEEENKFEETFYEDSSSECNIKIKIDESVSVPSAGSQPEIAHKSKDFKFTSTPRQSARIQSNKSLGKEEEDLFATVKCMNAINQISKNKKSPNDIDEFDALAISWAAKLRKLEEKQMVLAEGLISEALKKAYFKELTRDTTIKDDKTKYHV